MTVDLGGKTCCHVPGNYISGEMTLQSFESKILSGANFEPFAPEAAEW